MSKERNQREYKIFKRPKCAPPAWLFAPVWTVLYIIIGVSFGIVFYHAFMKEISFILVLPFILNLIFNALFTPIQFGLKNNILALIDILLVWVTLIILIVSIPYLLWVTFATVLQISITVLN